MIRDRGYSTRIIVILSLILVAMVGLSATQSTAQTLDDQLPLYLVRSSEEPLATIPIAVIPQTGISTIDVDPNNLDVNQLPDTVMTYTLDIDNIGSADLTWSIDEANNPARGFYSKAHPWLGVNSTIIEDALGLSDMAGKVPNIAPQVPVTITKVIWDQPISGPWGGVSDFWSPQNRGAYSANDFVLSKPESISLIFADGFENDNQLANVPAITWMIYPDASGIPAGHPEDGGGTEIWSYSAAPGASGVDITNNAISLDLVAAGQPLINLPSGTYWLTVYPTYTDPQYRWSWYMASPLGYTAQLIDPTDTLGLGFTSWTPWTSADKHIIDLAFRLEGPSICNQLSDIPWASISPTNGLTTPGGTSPVDVTIDSTGLQTGTYTGSLCVNSNDPSTPVAEVPLSLTVAAAPDLQIDKDDGGLTIAPGDTLTYTLPFTNTGTLGATGVVLTDTVPANTTFNPATSTAGWSCSPDNNAGSTCTLSIGAVSSGDGGGTADFVVDVDDPILVGVTQIDNTAEIGDDGANGPELNPGDNNDSISTPVGAAPDLQIDKAQSGLTLSPGDTLSYTLTYTNAGDQGASGVVLTDTVPANTAFNPAASTAGWSCAPDNNAGSSCTLSVGQVNGGGGGTADFAVDVDNPVPAGVTRIDNTAEIGDDGTNGSDQNPGDNNNSISTPIKGAPDLQIKKSAESDPTWPGAQLSYTMVYTNAGDRGLTGVVLTDTVPANTSFNPGASSPGWLCAPDNTAGSICALAIGTFSGGAKASVSFVVDVNQDIDGGIKEIINTVEIGDDGAHGPDVDPDNNINSARTALYRLVLIPIVIK